MTRLALDRGLDVTVLVRPGRRDRLTMPGSGARPVVVEGDLTDPGMLARAMDGQGRVISCLASRTGVPRDAWAIDHAATCAAIDAAEAAGVGHFTLLSAICVQKPRLAFQHAKLAAEAHLAASGLAWSVVRPTALMKSLSGQAARLRRGKPFLVFGTGEETACTPISDRDLADFLLGCASDDARHGQVLPVGGPHPALTQLEVGRQLAGALGVPFRVRRVNPRLLRRIARALDLAGALSPRLRDKAELARIGHYYATESMLVWDGARYRADLTPAHGEDTLADHFAALARGERADDRGDHAVF